MHLLTLFTTAPRTCDFPDTTEVAVMGTYNGTPVRMVRALAIETGDQYEEYCCAIVWVPEEWDDAPDDPQFRALFSPAP